MAPVPGDELKPKKSFFPEQVFKDTVAVFIAFAILFVMAIAVRVPLERMADPTDTSYIPRPEWYFLFLFQTLKVFEGPLEVVGTVVLPTLAILALILTPFIDRGKIDAGHGSARWPFGIVVLAALGWGGLTAAAVHSDSAANGRGADRFLRPDAVDATDAGRNGGDSLFPPGALRQLPQRGRRHAQDRAQSAQYQHSVMTRPG